jgi:hypothetical protein
MWASINTSPTAPPLHHRRYLAVARQTATRLVTNQPTSSWTPPLQAQHEGEAAPLWSALCSSDLQILEQAVAFASSPDNVTWFPQYGCALLVLRPHEEHSIQPAPAAISLSLVGLNEWRFRVHRWACTAEYRSTTD